MPATLEKSKPSGQVKNLRKELLSCTRSVLARLLKVTEMTVFRWEKGTSEPDNVSAEKLNQLATVSKLLLSGPKVIHREKIADWLERPLPALDNFRPIDLIGSEYGFHRLKVLLEELGKR